MTAAGIGIYPTIPDAISRMVNYARVFEPEPADVGIYRNLYERVYRKIYHALEPLYREIREITGYPEKETYR